MNSLFPRGVVSLVRQLLAAQCAITVAAAAIAFWMKGSPAALAAGYGGAVAVLPMLWMARKALSARTGATPQDMVGGFYRGEVGKLGLSAVMFFIGVKLFPANFAPLIVTFMAAQLGYWVVLGTYRDQESQGR